MYEEDGLKEACHVDEVIKKLGYDFASYDTCDDQQAVVTFKHKLNSSIQAEGISESFISGQEVVKARSKRLEAIASTLVKERTHFSDDELEQYKNEWFKRSGALKTDLYETGLKRLPLQGDWTKANTRRPTISEHFGGKKSHKACQSCKDRIIEIEGKMKLLSPESKLNDVRIERGIFEQVCSIQ